MLIYEILIKYVLSCMLICCVYGIFFKENFLEDGHNRWTKHAVSYAFYNTVNLRNWVCMALGSTQPLTEISTRAFHGGKGGRCVRLTTLTPSCAVVTKSGNLNFLEPSGSLQACNGIALPFLLCRKSKQIPCQAHFFPS